MNIFNHYHVLNPLSFVWTWSESKVSRWYTSIVFSHVTMFSGYILILSRTYQITQWQSLVYSIVILKKVFAYIVILMTCLWKENNLFMFPHYNEGLLALKLLNAFFKNAMSSIHKDTEKLLITQNLIIKKLSIYLHIILNSIVTKYFYDKLILKVKNC